MKTIGVSNILLTLFQSFLDNRYQRVLLNGQNSHWELIKAGVLKGSILGPLLFLIYINDLSNNLISNVKLFVDDTSIFSIVNNIIVSTEEINNDLKRISEWAYQWKMMFNLDLTKQAQEVIFSLKRVIRSWILVNTLMNKSLKHKKEYQSLKNFIIFCQEMRF